MEEENTQEEIRLLMKMISQIARHEGDCEHSAQSCKHGGLWYRFFMWMAQGHREYREKLQEELRDLRG